MTVDLKTARILCACGSEDLEAALVQGTAPHLRVRCKKCGASWTLGLA